MIRKSTEVTVRRPDYLRKFRYQEQPNIKEWLHVVKKGIYNLEREDMQLVDIIKDLQSNPKYAHKKIEAVGLIGYKS